MAMVNVSVVFNKPIKTFLLSCHSVFVVCSISKHMLFKPIYHS